MKKVLMFLMLLCSLTASAQDVIVKKNGSTVVCRIVEVGQAEVVYKRWTDLQGNNYVMNITDIASINYENGTKRDFTSDTAPVLGTTTKTIDDGALLAMANKSYDLKKAKKLKKTGWIGGSLLMVAGASCLIAGGITYSNEGYDYYYDSSDDTSGIILMAVGSVLTAGGITLTSVCVAKANRIKRQSSPFAVQSTPVLHKEFWSGNGIALSASLNTMQAPAHKIPGVGIGITCHL